MTNVPKLYYETNFNDNHIIVVTYMQDSLKEYIKSKKAESGKTEYETCYEVAVEMITLIESIHN
jgi:hypothetical protein